MPDNETADPKDGAVDMIGRLPPQAAVRILARMLLDQAGGSGTVGGHHATSRMLALTRDELDRQFDEAMRKFNEIGRAP